MLLLLDNYDSFTYNLYQALGQLYEDIRVIRNDACTVDQLEEMNPQALVLSPGPGYPRDAGVCLEAVRRFAGKIPILGVCLGHQSIGEAFGGKVLPARTLMHGKASDISLNQDDPLFAGLPRSVTAARYHSLIVERESLPSCLQVLGEDEDGQIMALRHKTFPIYGLQFHPESILTACGQHILENFLRMAPKLGLPDAAETQIELPDAQRDVLKPYLSKVIDGKDLTRREAMDAMICIMSAGATNAQIGSFLTALRMKGETVDEITGFAEGMRKKAKFVPHKMPVLDIVGTGGDMANTFNISTTSAFVIAGAGMSVAKHGNRSVSSRSGAADVLEALGFRLGVSPEQASECLISCGVSFLFAPSFHGSMKYAAAPRKEIGVRSVFNILGPLCNPAACDYILLGVYEEGLLEPMAGVLSNLGILGAMLVHGEDGLDEISIAGPTKICELRNGQKRFYTIRPEDFGLQSAPLSEVVGGTAVENAKITLSILSGEDRSPRRSIVLMNAGCGLYLAGKAPDIAGGIALARQSIDSGAAMRRLETLRSKLASY